MQHFGQFFAGAAVGIVVACLSCYLVTQGITRYTVTHPTVTGDGFAFMVDNKGNRYVHITVSAPQQEEKNNGHTN